MKTSNSKVTRETLFSEKSIAHCLDYSDEPKTLKEILSPEKDLTIEAFILGPKESHFQSNLLCLHYYVTIKRNNTEINFDYYGSHMDALAYTQNAKYTRDLINKYGDFSYNLTRKQLKDRKKINENLLYSLLCSIRCEFYIEPIFEDFCSDFGYDADSRKAFDLWQVCLKHSQKLRRIFTENEVEVFPS